MATTFKDYYATLGVARNASEKDIHSAFRKLARKYHPDINHDAGAEQRFKEINEAHEVLGDPEKRRKYDELGPRWQEYEAWERAGKPGQNPFGTGTGSFEYRTVSPDELEDLFGDSAPFSDFFQTFFGGSGRGFGGASGGFDARRGRATSSRRQALRGDDVEGEADITLEEAYRGTTRTVELEAGGRTRRVEVTIPAGIRDGARVRARGQGSEGSGGGASGDLYVRVRVRPHPTFTRDGDDLSARVPVPLHVAVTGGTVSVPTLRGNAVELTVPAGAQNGAKLRLRGLGMPKLRGDGFGDLIATVDVRLPAPMPDELRQWAASHGP
jgi:DnaJ-class molecular chaperone